MAFVLKLITDEEDNYTPPMVFRSKIKVGSASDCDIKIASSGILPLHCEIYPYANEHRIVGIHSASILINNADAEKWPAILSDGDVVSFADIKYKFHILHDAMRRSWKASFSSIAALFLLAMLIVFELVIIVWLPYNLKHQKEASLASMKQDTYLYIDNLRNATRGIDAGGKVDSKSVKDLLIGIENDIAVYIRKYRDTMGWDETRTVYRDLHALGNITDSWATLQNTYTIKLKLNPKTFIDNLADQLETKASLDTGIKLDAGR